MTTYASTKLDNIFNILNKNPNRNCKMFVLYCANDYKIF